ncbi:hypothetical protein [Halobacteriovorax sp. DPLXC-1]|uniref:hypothetical protein n=1 Tax=Halobacteriovorax sp. DPLXC-1 TaxID=3110771 RepID=UPI002FF15C63
MKVIIFILLLPIYVFAARECDFTVSSNNFVGTLTNNVQAVSHSFSIRRSNNANRCRTFRAFFSRGGSGNYNRQASSGTSSIPYNLYGDSNLVTVLKDYPDATQVNEYITGSLIDNNTNYNFNFFVKQLDLDSVFSTGDGYFGDNLQISFYSVENNGSLTYENTAYFYLQLIIPRYAELSLVPLGASHDPTSTQYVMNFGTLTSNEVQSATLNVKGNVGFGVYMTSQNGSALKKGSSNIPYQIKVGPTNYVSLSNAGQETYMFQKNTGTSINAESYPIDVRLGTVPDSAETGTYEDVITVTVKAW